MDDGALARVEALVELGRCSEAESMLARVLADRPDDHHAWCLLALAQDGLSHWSEMLRAANHAVAVAPDHEWGHRLASIVLARLEMSADAYRAAGRAAEIAPHSADAHFALGLTSGATGRHEKVAGHYREARGSTRSTSMR